MEEPSTDNNFQTLRKSSKTIRKRLLPLFVVLVVVVSITAIIALVANREGPESTQAEINVSIAAPLDSDSTVERFRFTIVNTQTKESSITYSAGDQVSADIEFMGFNEEKPVATKKVRLTLIPGSSGEIVFDNETLSLPVDQPVVLSYPPNLEPDSYTSVLYVDDLVVGERRFTIK